MPTENKVKLKMPVTKDGNKDQRYVDPQIIKKDGTRDNRYKLVSQIRSNK